MTRNYSNSVVFVLGALTPEVAIRLSTSAGVASQRGGITSHGANILREFGIPCIVGVQYLDSIPEGTLVRLDALEGRIEVLDEI